MQFASDSSETRLAMFELVSNTSTIYVNEVYKKNNCVENVFDIYPSLLLVLTDLNYIRSHF